MSLRNTFDPQTELTITSRNPETYRVVHSLRFLGHVRRYPAGWYCRELTEGDSQWIGGFRTKAQAVDALVSRFSGQMDLELGNA